MFSSPRPPANASTFPASPLAIPGIRILSRVRVTLRTVRFVQVVTMGLRCATDVLLMRHQLKMLLPYAVLVGAATFLNVIPLEASRRFTNEEVVSGRHLAIQVESPVTVAIVPSQPEGTAIGATRIDLRPEALFGSAGVVATMGTHLEPILSGVTERAVDAAPLPSILPDLTPEQIYDALYAIGLCESGGDYTTNTGNGFYGAYQFSLSTWYAVGGEGYPHLASPAEQDARAWYLLTRYGPQHWPVCQWRIQ